MAMDTPGPGTAAVTVLSIPAQAWAGAVLTVAAVVPPAAVTVVSTAVVVGAVVVSPATVVVVAAVPPPPSSPLSTITPSTTARVTVIPNKNHSRVVIRLLTGHLLEWRSSYGSPTRAPRTPRSRGSHRVRREPNTRN